MEHKQKFPTIEEYLEKMLYPTLRLAINDLINEIKTNDFYKVLEDDFNKCFFKNKAEIHQKQKQLLKLERGSDYSEGDYEYWLRQQHEEANESKSEKEENAEEDEDDDDIDLDDSDALSIQEEQLNKDEEEEKNKFDPIKFLVNKLRERNLNIKGGNNEIDLDKEDGEFIEGENMGDNNMDLLELAKAEEKADENK